jgi:hypothetical protein
MNFLYALFFGAGVAAFTYSRFGRRVGYGNTQNVVTIIALVFVITTVVFFTVFSTLLH